MNTVQKGFGIFLSLACISFGSGFIRSASAQQALQEGHVEPMGKWLEYRETQYTGEPIVVHLRTGYERAIVLPEPVVLSDVTQVLPGTEMIIDGSVVSFYPTRIFKRHKIIFVGKRSGSVYDLRIRASASGMRQPMRINR